MGQIYATGQIENIKIDIVLGDITQEKADAYIVPQFNNCASYGGVGGAIARSGAEKGLDEFDRYAHEKGKLPFGHVHVTEAGAGNAPLLFNAVSVGSGRDVEFETVHSCVYNALKAAERTGVKTIAAPAMGTGIIGDLSDKQSAMAMMSAVYKFAVEGGQLDKFEIVIYGNRQACADFADVLANENYDGAIQEPGERKFDIDRWVSGMQKDGVDVQVHRGPKDPNLN